jgi:predicted esterase
MKVLRFFIPAYFCAAQAFAAAPGKVINAPGKVTDSVICKADPSQSYALYIPVKGGTGALPVIYFFDPHGSGAHPLNKYRLLADRYGFILVGSNNSKNGNDWSTTEKIWQSLVADTKGRLNIDANRVYTCGFSGGAKVAGFVAIQHPGIRGVIAGGAGLPDGVGADNFDFSFTAIAGEGDMNLTELVGISGDLDKTRTRHRLLLFAGKHEWAPENTMNLAFAGLQLDAMAKGILPKNPAFIDQYVKTSKARLAADIGAGDLLKAERECAVSVSCLEGVDKQADWFRQQRASVTSSPKYKQQQQQEQALLAREESAKAGYMQHFQQMDPRYWDGIIADLKARAAPGRPDAAMYQRLQAWLSLAFYSMSNRCINANVNDQGRYFVDLYKKADPANSEAWYFSAILNARGGQQQAAAGDLERAAALGFDDDRRLHQQPEFRQMDLSRIKLHGNAKK